MKYIFDENTSFLPTLTVCMPEEILRLYHCVALYSRDNGKEAIYSLFKTVIDHQQKAGPEMHQKVILWPQPAVKEDKKNWSARCHLVLKRRLMDAMWWWWKSYPHTECGRHAFLDSFCVRQFM